VVVPLNVILTIKSCEPNVQAVTIYSLPAGKLAASLNAMPPAFEKFLSKPTTAQNANAQNPKDPELRVFGVLLIVDMTIGA
jgi:hypothetical protein